MEKYQTITRRFIAIVFDTAIFLAIIYIYEHFILNKRESVTIAITWAVVILISMNFYNIYLTYFYGQTFGKMLLKVKVVDITENSLTFYQAVLRRLVLFFFDSAYALIKIYVILAYGLDTKLSAIPIERFFFYFSLLIYTAEFIVMLSNSKHRSLDDYIAGTVVIRTNELPT
jgi:uncharacterized RDD family membrane protein YckC